MCLNDTQVCCNHKDIYPVFSQVSEVCKCQVLLTGNNVKLFFLLHFGNALTPRIVAVGKKAVALGVLLFYLAASRVMEILFSFLFCLQRTSDFEVLRSSASHNAICGPEPVPKLLEASLRVQKSRASV